MPCPRCSANCPKMLRSIFAPVLDASIDNSTFWAASLGAVMHITASVKPTRSERITSDVLLAEVTKFNGIRSWLRLPCFLAPCSEHASDKHTAAGCAPEGPCQSPPLMLALCPFLPSSPLRPGDQTDPTPDLPHNGSSPERNRTDSTSTRRRGSRLQPPYSCSIRTCREARTMDRYRRGRRSIFLRARRRLSNSWTSNPRAVGWQTELPYQRPLSCPSSRGRKCRVRVKAILGTAARS